MTTLSPSWLDDESPRDLWRWIVAAAIVVAIHAAVAGYFLARQQPQEIGDDTEAITVELAPIDSTPDAVARDDAPAPETMVESAPVPKPPKEKPREEMKVEQPPDEAPSPMPIPDVKPPEKVENSPPPAPVTAQQVKGGAPAIDPSWQASLVRQLQRFKRYPASAQSRKEEVSAPGRAWVRVSRPGLSARFHSQRSFAGPPSSGLGRTIEIGGLAARRRR